MDVNESLGNLNIEGGSRRDKKELDFINALADELAVQKAKTVPEFDVLEAIINTRRKLLLIASTAGWQVAVQWEKAEALKLGGFSQEEAETLLRFSSNKRPTRSSRTAGAGKGKGKKSS